MPAYATRSSTSGTAATTTTDTDNAADANATVNVDANADATADAAPAAPTRRLPRLRFTYKRREEDKEEAQRQRQYEETVRNEDPKVVEAAHILCQMRNSGGQPECSGGQAAERRGALIVRIRRARVDAVVAAAVLTPPRAPVDDVSVASGKRCKYDAAH